MYIEYSVLKILMFNPWLWKYWAVFFIKQYISIYNSSIVSLLFKIVAPPAKLIMFSLSVNSDTIIIIIMNRNNTGVTDFTFYYD